jgi:hypothetical protein
MLALFPLATLARLLYFDSTLDDAIAAIADIAAITAAAIAAITDAAIAGAAIAVDVAASSAGSVASEGNRTQQRSLAMIVVH